MAKATLFSRLLTHEDLEPNLVNNEVIGNIKNEENNNDEIVSQGSVRDKELVVQESLLNENDNWGPGETIKTLWHAIRERAGGLGNFFLNMFKSYDASGLRKLLTELESGSRVVKTDLTDTDKEKLNKIFGSIGEFDYDVGGNCKDIITFINNVMDTLDKNKRGSFGWILDNKFDIEHGRKALVKDKVSSELFSRLLKAHPEGFSIDPRSDNYVAGYIVNPFATHLSIYSIMYIPELDSIKTESDIVRNPRPANVYPATLDGAKALLKFGIDFEDKIKNLASKIKLDSLKTSTIESHLSLRDAAYYSARALSTLDSKLENVIRVFTKRHIDSSNEDLDINTDTCISSPIDKEFTNPELSSKLNETIVSLNKAIDSNDEVHMTKVGETTVEMLQELKYEYNLPVMTTVSKEDFIYDPKGCCKKLCIELSNEFFGWFGSKTKNDKVTPRTQAVDFRSVNNNFKKKLNTLIDRYTSLSSNKDISTKKVFISKEQDNKFLMEGLGKDTSWYTAIDYMLFNLSILDKARRTDLGPDDIYNQLKDLSSLLTPRAKKDADYKPSKNNKYYALVYSKNKISNSGAEGMLPVAEYRKSEDTNESVLYMDSHYAQDIISFSVDPIGGAVVDSVCKQSGFGYVIKDALRFLKELKKYVDNKSKDIKNKSINNYTTDQIETERYHATINDAFDNCAIGVISLILAMDSCVQEYVGSDYIVNSAEELVLPKEHLSKEDIITNTTIDNNNTVETTATDVPDYIDLELFAKNYNVEVLTHGFRAPTVTDQLKTEIKLAFKNKSKDITKKLLDYLSNGKISVSEKPKDEDDLNSILEPWGIIIYKPISNWNINEFVILFNVNGNDECLALGYSFENKEFKVGRKSSIWDHLCGDKSPVKESLLDILK